MNVYALIAQVFLHFSFSVQDLDQLNVDDKHHSEKVQGFFNTTSIPVLSLSGINSVHRWPIS